MFTTTFQKPKDITAIESSNNHTRKYNPHKQENYTILHKTYEYDYEIKKTKISKIHIKNNIERIILHDPMTTKTKNPSTKGPTG